MLSQHVSVLRIGELLQHRTFSFYDMNMTALGFETHAESKLGDTVNSSLALTKTNQWIMLKDGLYDIKCILDIK